MQRIAGEGVGERVSSTSDGLQLRPEYHWTKQLIVTGRGGGGGG
jgi:hypothetical protein